MTPVSDIANRTEASPSSRAVQLGERKKSAPWLSALVAIVILLLSIVILWRQFQHHSLGEIVAALHQMHYVQIARAVGFAALSYFLLTLYDVLAVSYAGGRLCYRKIVISSLAGHCFTNTIGFTLFTGTSIRYSFYASWGLSARHALTVVIFCVFTGWAGLLALNGLLTAISPALLVETLGIGSEIARGIGLLFLILAVVYVASNAVRRSSLRIGPLSIARPGVHRALAQIILAPLDWMAVAAVIYSLLPAGLGLTYPTILGVFLISQIAGCFSQVPGGLGVFEVTLLTMIRSLCGDDATPAVLSSLLAYRAIYCLLPLSIVAPLFGIRQLRIHTAWRNGRHI